MISQKQIDELATFMCKYGFSFYGDRCLSKNNLAAELPKEESFLFARAEQSGCEGCYCEVARVDIVKDPNEKRVERKISRYAYVKFFGGEIKEELRTDEMTAQHAAKVINEAYFQTPLDRFVCLLPDYVDPGWTK